MLGRVVIAMLLGVGVAVVAYELVLAARHVKETKERFHAIDARIEETLPEDVGSVPQPTFADDALTVRIRVFRRDMRDPEKAYTLIKIDNERQTYALPRGWQGRLRETQDRSAAYDETLAQLKAVVRRKIAAHGGPADEVKGEIIAAPPMGGAVPHGDIVQVLNVFLEVGMIDVVFEGAATPLTNAERAARMRESKGQAPRGDGR